MIRLNARHMVVGALVWFVTASCVVMLMRGMVNSPDERANLTFAHTWMQHSEMSVLGGVAQPRAYPLFARSTAPVDDRIKPSGFVGLSLLYGTVAKFVGGWVIFFLTLVCTALASFAFYFLMRRIFDDTIAQISWALFLFQPAVVYYSIRGLFPNVLLVDLIIGTLAASWYVIEKRGRTFVSIVPLVSAAAALVVRPLEAFAVFALATIGLVVFGKDEERKIGYSGLGIAFLVGLFLLFLRGVGLLPGYSFVQTTGIFGLIFPFGVHLIQTARTVWHYMGILFLPWTVGAVVGLWYLCKQIYRERVYTSVHAAYVAVTAVLSGWLFILYGSWVISDNPADSAAVTLGSSYVRYWLPIFVACIPFVAVSIVALCKRLTLQRIKIVIAIIGVLSVWRVAYGVDGMYRVLREVRGAYTTVAEVRTLVPAGSVLAVRAWDKHFFPEYAVLQPFPRDQRTLAAAHELVERSTPVYAFIENLTDTDMLWFEHNNLFAQLIKKFGIHSLYRLQLWGKK